jgi:hypothetical protein
MFPESRGVLFIFSPILGLFFCTFAYFVHDYKPTDTLERAGKVLLLEVLASFLSLCFIGLFASIVGPNRIRPLISRVGLKAAVAGLLLIIPLLGLFLVGLYYAFVS